MGNLTLLSQLHAIKIVKASLTKNDWRDDLCACILLVKGERILKLLDK